MDGGITRAHVTAAPPLQVGAALAGTAGPAPSIPQAGLHRLQRCGVLASVAAVATVFRRAGRCRRSASFGGTFRQRGVGVTCRALSLDDEVRLNLGRADANANADAARRNDEAVRLTLERVALPTVLALFGGAALYFPATLFLQGALDIGDTGDGPILKLLGMDQSQYLQNFLTVNGLLFTILCGQTYESLYSQQERLYNALFMEVTEAKSLLEQICLLCQNRPFYQQLLQSISNYVQYDLRRIDVEPAELLAGRPMDDPLECILYVTSVGVPSIVYSTVRDLRQARSQRLAATQRKFPKVHFVLLYVLGGLELMAFPLLGAGTASMFRETNVLGVQAILFGAMCGAIVMTLQVIYELWKPAGGAYTVDALLRKMVRGLEQELQVRREVAGLPPDVPDQRAVTASLASVAVVN